MQADAQCTSTINSSFTNVCSGDSVYLTAAPTGQQNYEWFLNGTSIGSGSSAYYLTNNLTAGTYVFEVEITDNNNCVSTSAPLTITVNTAPSISLTNNGPLCVGGTLQLSATVTNATAYQWNGPQSFTSSQLNPSISNIQQNQGGLYSLAATNGNCTVSAGTQVVVNGNTPTVTASVDSGNNTCVGSWVMFDGATTNLTGVTYSWSGPNNFTSTSANPWISSVTTAASGVYTLTVTGTGCSGTVTITDTALLNVNTVPTVTASSNGAVCVGGTIQLNGSVSAGTYWWSGPMGFTSTSLNPTISNAQLTHSGTYTLMANNGCYASDAVNISVMSNNPTVNATTSGTLCVYDSTFGNGASINAMASGLSGVTYSWTGPNSFSSSSAYNMLNNTSSDAGTYTVTVTGTGCAGSVTLTDNVFVSGAACDSVWPGDTDNSFEVTNWDLLNIGVAYGATGTARTGASNNWIAQYATDWNTTFTNTNQNHKYADCNGDGVVNGNDTVAVMLNYGQWHNKGVHVPLAKSASDPDLYFDMAGVTLTPGATVTVPIKLGTSNLNMNNIYGIAASVKIQGITPSSSMSIASNGWMGDNTNSMAITKAVNNNQTDWTLVRTNHANVSGDGTIATLTFTVPAGSENQNVLLYFENVKMIENDGSEITNYNLVDDNSVVYPLSVNAAIANASSAIIVPNPSDAQANVQFSLMSEAKLHIAVTDITGRVVWSQEQMYAAGAQSIALPNATLAPGMYHVQLRDSKGSVTQNIKWVKK